MVYAMDCHDFKGIERDHVCILNEHMSTTSFSNGRDKMRNGGNGKWNASCASTNIHTLILV